MPTARVGLVGGLGPESTVDYYRRILDGWSRRHPGSAPPLVIDSLDVQHGLRLIEHDQSALVEYLLESVERLAGAGATFAAITANTPHLVFDDLAARCAIPLLSIVEVCANEAQRRSLTRVALLGTRFTMEASFYPDVFGRRRIGVVRPGASDRAWVHDRYVNELLKGQFRSETREQFLGLIAQLRSSRGIDGVVLGGTELPLLLRASDVSGLPILDTTAIHVDAIVDRLAQGR